MKKPWPPEDIAWLEREYANAHTPTLAKQMDRTPSSIYQKALGMGLKKSAEYLASPLAGRTDGKRGGEGRFKPGHKTWNAGMKGWSPAGTEATRFKKGEMHGAAQHNYVPIGSHRISKDGYLERKVNDDHPAAHRWVSVHILIWSEANGPVPPSHTVVFKDGNKQRIVLENLEMISRAELMNRNTVHRYPPDLKAVMRLQAQLTRRLNEQH